MLRLVVCGKLETTTNNSSWYLY